jgi:predicted metalloprotease with PDZ domain
MPRRSILALVLATLAPPVSARPLPTRAQDTVRYTLRVAPGDTSSFSVEMHIHQAGDTFQLAMMAHPEYDSRFWRYLEGLEVTNGGPDAAGIVRLDSALWRVVAPGGACVIRYRLRLPPPPYPFRSAWVPFLASQGGLVGGPPSFLYIVGRTGRPAAVTFDLPAGWAIATALAPTADPRTYVAIDVADLLDAPALIGRLHRWRFSAGGVPHRVAYWASPGAQPFDTAALVDGLQRLAHQAVMLFGGAPFREYTFLVEDGALGSLEHRSSVTLGAPSDRLARGLTDFFAEAAHEYFHAWNLVSIHPVEYGGVDYQTPPRSHGLWWGEGITMLYADLLLRRAGLPVFDSTRIAHLESLIGRYLANPAYERFTAESISAVAYGAPPDALGDYNAGPHLQGELIGTVLDLKIRDATGGRRSLDDVLRAMQREFSGPRGYTGRDIERVVAATCGCPMRAFFDAHVRGNRRLDLDGALRLIGLRMRVTREPARDRDGAVAPDLRLYAWVPPGAGRPSLVVTDPASLWARAGLHSGDRVMRVNGAAIDSVPQLRRLVGGLRIGDTVAFDVTRPSGRPFRTTVHVAGFERPVVRIEALPDATERQRAWRARWLAGTP